MSIQDKTPPSFGEFDSIQSEEFSSTRSFITLFKKEMLRMWAVAGQTLLAPVVTATLYLLIFGVSLGSRVSLFEDISYIQFVIPGLALMGVINNAFANCSSSLFISKYLGNIADLLVTPLTPLQFMFAYSLAAIIRALAVGSVVLLVSTFFTDMPWANPGQAFLMALVSAFLFAQFGLITAIFAKSFDSLSVFTNFMLMPLIYLGGLFYPVQQLPSPWNTISMFNPLYYLIEGFRAAILGKGEIPILISFSISTGLALALSAYVVYLFKHSPRLRN